jgi:acetyl-CoA carboxylase biotin carboxyl carrier protein
MPNKLSVDAEALKLLTQALKEANLTELEYQQGETKIRLSAMPPSPVVPTFSMGSPLVQQVASSPMIQPEEPESVNKDEEGFAVTSPIVGTVYVAPKPGDPPFVKEGDAVEEGQTLLIIEAMKVMNPVRAPHRGYIKKVLIHNAAPVEFGETLLTLEKAA